MFFNFRNNGAPSREVLEGQILPSPARLTFELNKIKAQRRAGGIFAGISTEAIALKDAVPWVLLSEEARKIN